MHSSVIPVTACECSVTVVIRVGDGGLLVVGDVTVSVGVGLPVGSAVLMLLVVLVLLVVLASVKMYKYVCTVQGSHFAKVMQWGCFTPCFLLFSILCSLQQVQVS